MENTFNACDFYRLVYPNQHPLETDNDGRNLYTISSTLLPFLVYAAFKSMPVAEACNATRY